MLAQKKSDLSYRAFALADGLPSWYEDHEVQQDDAPRASWVRREGEGWVVQTLEGTERATNGDWCVEGAKGEYYPMSEKSFRSKYEPATDGRWKRIATPLECWLFDSTDLASMPAWMQQAIEDGFVDKNESSLVVHTSWGDQLATLGNDVLICAGPQDIYPCKRDIFEITYEVLEG